MLPSCTFCRAEAWVAPTDEYAVCRRCAPRIATLALESPPEIWEIVAPPRQRTENEQRLAPPGVDVDQVLEEFKAGVERQIPPEDAASHLNLAEAYVMMGMHADALREAAIGVSGDRATAKAALRLLLTAPLLRAHGMRKLRARLARVDVN